jgi:hypothetical protein
MSVGRLRMPGSSSATLVRPRRRAPSKTVAAATTASGKIGEAVAGVTTTVEPAA